MSNDRRDGNGSSNGGDQDAPDAISGPDDPTVVIVPDEFLVGALGRLSGGLRGAADRSDGLREMVEEGLAELVLEELDEDLRELEILAGGARRGVSRLRAFLAAKNQTKP